MREKSLIIKFEIPEMQKWVSVVNPYFLSVRPAEVFEDLGFPPAIVRKYVSTYPYLCLNDGSWGKGRGVSDGVILRILAGAIGADCSEGDAKLCRSNQVKAWQAACLARLDEMEAEDTPKQPNTHKDN